MSVPKGKYCENNNYKTCEHMSLDTTGANSVCAKYGNIGFKSEWYRNQPRTIKCKQCLTEGKTND